MIERVGSGSPSIVLGSRFNGPPSTANGGYACGSLAAAMGLPFGPVSVRLHRPVPLETALRVTGADDPGTAPDAEGAAMFSGEILIATGAPAAIDPTEPPVRPDRAAAEDARRRHHDFGAGHPLAQCFVCGAERPDGLHVSAGPIATDGTGDVVATPFEPDASFGTDGVVNAAVVWGALDCPSYPMSAMRSGQTCLLGTFRAAIGRDVLVGERLVVAGWTNRQDGRKYVTSSALLDDAGTVIGAADAVWIGVADEYARTAGG